MDIAPLSLLSWGLGVVLGGLDVTYLFSIQAARMMAPAGPSFLLLKSASVMPVSTVTGSPSPPFKPLLPVNVILDNALLSLLPALLLHFSQPLPSVCDGNLFN